jgi:hypothetical protein
MKIEYTSKMGEAGQQYLDELCKDANGERMFATPWLPGTFRWYDLLDRMLAAAPNVFHASTLEAVAPVERLQLIELYNDVNKIPGNTTRAYAEHIWNVGYRKYPPALLNRMVSVKDRLPDPQNEDKRVLVYTEDTSFAGEQYFDIKASDLYGDVDPESQKLTRSEVAEAATHWMELPHPAVWGDAPSMEEGDFSARSRAELVNYISACRSEIDGLTSMLEAKEKALAAAMKEVEQLKRDKAYGEAVMFAADRAIAQPQSEHAVKEFQFARNRFALRIVPSKVCFDEACADGQCNSNMCQKSFALLQVENPDTFQGKLSAAPNQASSEGVAP